MPLASAQPGPPAEAPLPARLAIFADSANPATANKVRRWSLLALAGPALSYRTLRQPQSVGGSEVARLERPALGFGAQLQVRRALNGRWALAAGLGYQQYATRLTLQVVSLPIPSQLPNTSAPAPLPSQAVRSRDTYHVLMLPVQLRYALGVPGPHWQLAALGGFEPGYFVGASSTADNTYSTPSSYSANLADFYSQRTYSGAHSSPFQTWNLALSLGLELRYRPAPASRWQVLVQPTGRYIATPFMRADAPDYSRQPFSVGLLAGFGWDL